MASTSNAIVLPTQPLLSRPQSHASGELEFDSGINSSNAWTGSLATTDGGNRIGNAEKSLSDDDGSLAEKDEDLDDEPGRPARALYPFEGRAEFRELTRVGAGDELEVLKEDVGEGWSLVRIVQCAAASSEEEHAGEVGLIPRTYYTFTKDFATTPGLDVSERTRMRSRREASSSSLTPRGSPTSAPSALPLVPQTTGEWFPSFRRSLLGGRALNRFSSFVTSGAEAWLLHGAEEEPAHGRELSWGGAGSRVSVLGAETETHYVDAGPAWKSKAPAFRVLVHSPSKRSSTLTGAYTVYTVTSLFDARAHVRSTSNTSADDDGGNENADEQASDEDGDGEVRVTVQRRFSHFVALHTALLRRLPGLALPPLPEKQYAGRFNDDFVEARRGDLERYINRVARHPIARYAEVFTFFLGCESDSEWKKQLPTYLALPPKGPAFYAHIYHPAFNLDAEEAAEAVERFEGHTKAVGRGVQGLRGVFGKAREARIEMSRAERLLSYALLSLITAKPLATPDPEAEGDEEEARPKGHTNEDGAWCWREGCAECLRLTKALHKTAETLQSVADLYDDHARRTQLATHEALKNVVHPYTHYEAVIDTHKSTLSRYQEAIQPGSEDEEVAARCETVLNTTMAEMDIYHTQKVADFQTLATEHLDGEIAFYEQVLGRLRTARRTFNAPHGALTPGPRQSSRYERELAHPRLQPPPLAQPAPHVFDSAPMRPVSVAVKEGVGMILGAGGAGGRGSVFGFW